jgi:hypothetical protein
MVLPLRGLHILKRVYGRKLFEEIQVVMKSEKTQQLYYKMGLNQSPLGDLINCILLYTKCNLWFVVKRDGFCRILTAGNVAPSLQDATG